MYEFAIGVAIFLILAACIAAFILTIVWVVKSAAEVKRLKRIQKDEIYKTSVDLNSIEIRPPNFPFKKPMFGNITPGSIFDNLLMRLSHFQEYGIHRYLDILLFALFKLRMNTVLYVTEHETEEEAERIMAWYDLWQGVALCTWMNENAPEFANQADIIDNRFNTYRNLVLNNNIQNDIIFFSMLSSSFCWLLDNGWETQYGKVTTQPRRFNFDIHIIKQSANLRGKYSKLLTELDEIVTFYFAREHTEIISRFKCGVN